MSFSSDDALELRLAPRQTSSKVTCKPLLHHSMPGSICLEWERRHNADQYKMFSWNGWELPCAEDCEYGVANEINLRDDQHRDWGEDGMIVEARRHPKRSKLKLARALFGQPSVLGNRKWRFGEKCDPCGVLNEFTLRSMRIFDVVDRHLMERVLQPLFWPVVKALRDAQAVLKTPSYTVREATRNKAPRGILRDQSALPPRSAELTAAGSWCGVMTLGLVADFLVSRRVFLAWSTRARKKSIEKRKPKRKRSFVDSERY
jgi:hypothetical protein